MKSLHALFSLLLALLALLLFLGLGLRFRELVHLLLEARRLLDTRTLHDLPRGEPGVRIPLFALSQVAGVLERGGERLGLGDVVARSWQLNDAWEVIYK